MSSLVYALGRKVRQIPISENTTLLILAVSVGIFTAGGIWLFRTGFEFFTRFYREGLETGLLSGLGKLALIPILALGGLIVGVLKERFVGEERHHGVAGIMESVTLAGGRLPYRKMPIKAALAALSIGAGASVGPEDPSVQIGANLGSLLGQRLHLSDERVRLLVAAGAASGIAAVFHAPIAGVFFALEVILGDFSTSSFGVVVLSAVIASVFTRAIDVGGPELGIRNYALGGPQEIPLYVILGLLAAPVAMTFIRLLYWQQDVWHHLTLSQPLKTTLAGAIVAVIGIALPEILGTGRETMNLFLNQSGDFTLWLLLALVAAKMIATTISLGGGFVGGMFAPSLFVGAALGGLYGRIVVAIFPSGNPANPAAFAMACMAALMAGVIRSPITAVLLLFELTNDYNLILPIMLTVAVCLFLVERLAPDGIYHLGLARKGVRLQRGRDIDLMQTITAGEAMGQSKVIPASATLEAVGTAFANDQTHGFIVVDEAGLLYGILTLQDWSRAQERPDAAKLTAANICTKEVITVTPDTPIARALHLIGERDLGRLPVVASDDPRRVVGLLRRRDIMRAYEIALQRRSVQQQRAEQVRLAAYSRSRVIERSIEQGAPADQHMLAEIGWPAGSVIASIWRQGQIITPNGKTRLQAGDVLTIVTTAEREPEIAGLLLVDHSLQQST